MEIKITTRHILLVLHVISYIIFIGLCVEAGGFIFNTFFSMVSNSEGARNFWQQADLSGLYKYDKGHFLVVTIYMIIVALMRAFLFYLIIKILHNKHLDMSKPFTKEVGRFISNASYLAIGVGLFSYSGVKYTKWLASQGISMPSAEALRLEGADIWLFMGVTLLVVAQIFKRGIQIQSENDLTV